MLGSDWNGRNPPLIFVAVISQNGVHIGNPIRHRLPSRAKFDIDTHIKKRPKYIALKLHFFMKHSLF